MMICVIYLHLFLLILTNSSVRTLIQKNIESDPARIETYPFMVSLQENEKGHFCSGSLISDQWILSAAYCVYIKDGHGEFTFMEASCCYAVVGETSVATKPTEDNHVFDLSGFIVHPLYNTSRLEHNIACIKIKGRIIFEQNIKPVVLANTGNNYGRHLPQVFSCCTNVGWQIQNNFRKKPKRATCDTSTFLRTIDTTPAVNYECEGYRKGVRISSNLICTVTETDLRKAGECYFDYGEPLICGEEQIQYGIETGDVACSQNAVSTLYTRVDQYEKWIFDCTLNRYPMDSYLRSKAVSKSATVLFLLVQLVNLILL